MKWLTRRPSMRIQCMTAALCAAIVFSVVRWLIQPSNDRASTVGRWIRKEIIEQPAPVSMRQPVTCYVTEMSGVIEVLDDGGMPTEMFWEEEHDDVFVYTLDTQPSGFLAPTRLRIRHYLFETQVLIPSYPQELQAFSQRWNLGLTPDESGRLAVDPRLLWRRYFDESRIVWSGYLVNTVFLLAVLGLVWSFTWMPSQILRPIRAMRLADGMCPFCRYDVSATPGRCPECGWGHAGEGNGDIS